MHHPEMRFKRGGGAKPRPKRRNILVPASRSTGSTDGDGSEEWLAATALIAQSNDIYRESQVCQEFIQSVAKHQHADAARSRSKENQALFNRISGLVSQIDAYSYTQMRLVNAIDQSDASRVKDQQFNSSLIARVSALESQIDVFAKNQTKLLHAIERADAEFKQMANSAVATDDLLTAMGIQLGVMQQNVQIDAANRAQSEFARQMREYSSNAASNPIVVKDTGISNFT